MSTLALAAVVLAGADWAPVRRQLGLPGGPLDELAHLLPEALKFSVGLADHVLGRPLFVERPAGLRTTTSVPGLRRVPVINRGRAMNALTSQLDSKTSLTQVVLPQDGLNASAPPRISVVTCAYTEQRWDALVDAVASAHAQDPPPHEVVVVIDHNDDLLGRARRELPRARVVANEESRGLSGARNTGIRHATGEIVAFLDDDARARPRWLQALTRPFEDPAVIGAGGLALPVWESGAPAWIPPEFLWVVGCSYRGLPPTSSEIRNPIGANMAFRRSVLERVGGFTDGIGRVGRTPLGCEETELSIRALVATGGRIVQIPDAQVEHRVSRERTRWRYFRRRCWAEGLSKAVVARSVGSDAALESERSYVTRTLPAGVTRGLADAVRGDRSGVARSGAILAGLTITAAGYLLGLLSAGLRGHR